eukprot:TRINITY_DN280_c1_g4_i1.p1 TRINITY_DN280_c1_g4~~TRINITY_DN280_c1_g4_i1.p1  ORF type:complete len:744 (+),score=142.10 TRINITY_DN280_c1_g4_i1:68-2299(+)
MSRKAPKAGKEKEKEVEVLSAVLLADSFSEDFRPISYDIPRVLMPVAGVTMLDYAIEFLVSNGIDQIFIVANSHSQAIEDHVNGTKRRSSHRAEVSVLRCQSDCVASAIREISEHDVLRRDFVLLTGDVITNMTLLRKMWQTHMVKTEADKSILMTLILQEQPQAMELYRRRMMEVSVVNNTKLATDDEDEDLPQLSLTVDTNPAHKGILGEDRVSAVIDPISNNLLQYVPWKGDCPPLGAKDSENSSESSHTSSSATSSSDEKEHLSLLLSLMAERPTLSIRSDLIETGMAICSMRLLELFDQNFDFRDMRDCVKSVISDDLLGNKIVVDIIPESCYLRRVRTLESMSSISRVVLERWAYPLLVTAPFASNYHNLRTSSSSSYIDVTAKVAHSVALQKSYLIGPKVVIGDGSIIANSVLGEGVTVGKNCTITNSQIWSGATIGDNTTVDGSIICTAEVGSGCSIDSGCVVATKVTIKDNQQIPKGTRLTTKIEDWDNILELKPEDSDVSLVGEGGYGKAFVFDLTEANLDLHKLCFPQAADAKSTDTLFTRSSSSTGPIGRETDEDRFAKNVIELLERAISGDLEYDGTCVELRSLKFSYDVTTVDTCRAILLGILHSVEHKVEQDSSLTPLKTFRKVLSSWGKILIEFDSNSAQYAVLETLVDFATGAPAVANKISSFIYALYDGDYLSDETILKLEENWASQKGNLDKVEAKMVEACEELFAALNEESEEEEEEESDESD